MREDNTALTPIRSSLPGFLAGLIVFESIGQTEIDKVRPVVFGDRRVFVLPYDLLVRSAKSHSELI